MRRARYGELDVRIAASASELATTAANDFAQSVKQALTERDEVSVIFSKGGAHTAFVRAVRDRDDIEWHRIVVLHAKEYFGLAADHPASSRRWLRENLLAFVEPKEVHDLQGDHEPIEDEVERYDSLLRELHPDICLTNIGQNGHLAFIDPPADFETEDLVQLVRLDEWDRGQQVTEGHFPTYEESPEQALSLTIRGLLHAREVYVLTPQARKAPMVKRALEAPPDPACPASILTTAAHARLYLDEDSAADLTTSPT